MKHLRIWSLILVAIAANAALETPSSSVDDDWKAAYGNYALDKDPFYNWRPSNVLPGGFKCLTDDGKFTLPLTCYSHPKNNHKFCDLKAPVRIDPSKLSYKVPGGLPMSEIRNSQDSGPITFNHGWMSIPSSMGCQTNSLDGLLKSLPDHLPSMIRTIDLNGPELPSTTNAKRTLVLVQRYEYVNLYHTMTDWYNVCDAIDYLFTREAIQTFDDFDIMVTDTHCQGSLDIVWEDLYGKKLKFLTDSAEDVAVYDRVLFVSPGYQSPITGAMYGKFANNIKNPAQSVLAFRNFFMKRYGLFGNEDTIFEKVTMLLTGEQQKMLHQICYPALEKATTRTRWLTVVFRGDYRPHPRHLGVTGRKISNEAELLASLAKTLRAEEDGSEWGVRGVHLEDTDMAGQLALYHTSDILISIHGAALSNVIFMRPGTLVIELQPTNFRRPHFPPMARAVGADHEIIYINSGRGEGPYQVNLKEVSARVMNAVDSRFSRK